MKIDNLGQSLSSDKKLNLLIIEDSEHDAELIAYELKRFGYDVSWTCVDDKNGLRWALKSQSWDVAISDYAMPTFTGLEALRIVQSEKSDTPFILVSGTIGEEIAVEAMRAGVSDYLLKDRMARLGPAIERALREASDRKARKRAEEALRESEEKYRLLAENVSDVIFTMDLDLRVTYISPSIERMSGWTSEEWLSFKPTDYLPPASLELANKVLAEELVLLSSPNYDRNRVRMFEMEQYGKDGTVYWAEVSARFLYDDEGAAIGIIGATRDISERKQIDEHRKRLFTAVEQAGESIVITDPDGIISYANPAFAEISGFYLEEIIGKTASILQNGKHNQSFFKDMWSTIEQGKVWRGRFMNHKKDGSHYEETATVSPIKDEAGSIVNYVIVGRDVTSEIQLQNQLFQAQKMEAVGTLAGGIAHDFNNLLQAILGYTDLLLLSGGIIDSDRKSLRVIKKAARDGADLISRILTFSKKVESKTRPMALNEEVRGAVKLLYRTLPKMIEIELDLADDLMIVDADSAQIEQVILNLCLNAQHAMPDGGRLLIETSNVTLDEEYARTHLGAVSGKHVLLSVSDNGIGMPSEIVERIFEPFFTTKTNEGGTGLGLATVHGIVSQHGGHITCYSEPGIGTSLKVYLPVSASELMSDPDSTTEMPAFGNETILLVDDDNRIRGIGQKILEKFGYKAVTAKSGEEALAIYPARKDEIALIVLDLIMPGMGGKRCLQELLLIDRDVKVLLASGYSSSGLVADEKLQGAKGFLDKPYEAKNFLREIRKTLDEG